MNKKLIAKRFFGKGTVDITDPCYNKDCWCRINSVKIKPGEYACRIWREADWDELNGKRREFTRVGIIGIYLNDVIPPQDAMVNIGDIGVDSGLAGFFEDKPDYNDGAWHEFCEKTFANPNKDAWNFSEGFFSSTGYGDGGYPVYAYENADGEITALEIRFL